MPITPSQLANRRVAVTFEFGGMTAKLEYRPAVLSGDGGTQINELRKRLIAANEANDEAEVATLTQDIAAWISRLLASWDYMEDPAEDGTPGEMVPLTPERIAAEMDRFGDFIIACVAAAAEDHNAGKPSGVVSSAPSGDTSSPTAA